MKTKEKDRYAPTDGKRLKWTSEGEGLYVLATSNGSRSWYLRRSVGGKPEQVLLGTFDELRTISDARTALEKLLKSPPKNASIKVPGCFWTYLEKREKKEGLKVGTIRNYSAHFKNFEKAFAHFSFSSLDELTSANVSGFFDYVRATYGTYTTTFGYSLLKSVYQWLRVNGAPELVSPFEGAKRSMITGKGSVSAPLKHYTDTEAFKAFVKKVEAVKNLPVARDCIMSIVYLPLRPMEMCRLTWDSVDMEKRLIVIMPDQNKTGKTMAFPVVDSLYKILKNRSNEKSGAYIFSNRAGGDGHIKRDALTRLLEQIGEKGNLDVHGLRHTFRTIADEYLNLDAVMLEIILGHSTGNVVEATYNRSVYIERKREVLTKWEEFVNG